MAMFMLVAVRVEVCFDMPIDLSMSIWWNLSPKDLRLTTSVETPPV